MIKREGALWLVVVCAVGWWVVVMAIWGTLWLVGTP